MRDVCEGMHTSSGCEEYQEGWLLRVGAQTQATYSTTSYSTASGPWRCMLKNRHLDTHVHKPYTFPTVGVQPLSYSLHSIQYQILYHSMLNVPHVLGQVQHSAMHHQQWHT